MGVGVGLKIGDIAHIGVFMREKLSGIDKLLSDRVPFNCRREGVVVAI